MPKVGEKTATELMKQFGSLDAIYEHVEEITKKAVRESLIANKDLADLSKVLATINVNGEIEFAYEDAKIGDFYTPEAYKQFKRLGFKNMLSRFEKNTVDNKQTDYFKEITDLGQVEEIFAKFSQVKEENMLLLR